MNKKKAAMSRELGKFVIGKNCLGLARNTKIKLPFNYWSLEKFSLSDFVTNMN